MERNKKRSQDDKSPDGEVKKLPKFIAQLKSPQTITPILSSSRKLEPNLNKSRPTEPRNMPIMIKVNAMGLAK